MPACVYLLNLSNTSVLFSEDCRGAKTAMAVALRSPDRISALIPVDNAPVHAPLQSDFPRYVQGMEHVERENVTKQSEADAILKEYEEVSTHIQRRTTRSFD